jgi:hypothetical protein
MFAPSEDDTNAASASVHAIADIKISGHLSPHRWHVGGTALPLVPSALLSAPSGRPSAARLPQRQPP